MHSHIFLSSSKKDVCYCKICSKLSYKGNIGQESPIKIVHKFDVDPLKFKFKPFSAIANYSLPNHIKYLESKKIGIYKIKYLVSKFGLRSMVFYKAINFMNEIFLKTELSIENIENVASICVLLITLFNECCLPLVNEEFLSLNEYSILYHYNSIYLPYDKDRRNIEILNKKKIKHKKNINGLVHYIKKNVNNCKYWEVLCLKVLNYDLGKYSAYDYLILFFELGIIFVKEKINIIEILKYCIYILDFIINEKKSCDYSQYTLAMSIIKVALENNSVFDKNVFKYIYGVDLSKKKYIYCSNMIKKILNLKFNTNIIINLNLFNSQINQYHKYDESALNILSNQFINDEEEKNNNINHNYNNIIVNKQKQYCFNDKNYLDQLEYIINNSKNIIIKNNFINNNININNNNFFYRNYIISNYYNYINNIYNTYKILQSDKDSKISSEKINYFNNSKEFKNY
jgi:hypothetical protein